MWNQVVDEFYRPFERTLEHAMQNAEEITIPDEVADQQCPQCGRNLVIKQGRCGRFLACPGFQCRFTKPIVDELDVSCPVAPREGSQKEKQREDLLRLFQVS